MKMPLIERLWWYYCTPYGVWHCAKGRVVLFNRRYEPIAAYEPLIGPHIPASCDLFKRAWADWEPPVRGRPEGDAQYWEPELVKWKHQRWFYSDRNPPWYDWPGCAETRVRVFLTLADFLEGKLPLRAQ